MLGDERNYGDARPCGAAVQHAEPAVAVHAEIGPDWDTDVSEFATCDDVPIHARASFPDIPEVYGVVVSDGLLAAIGRVEAALAVARVARPGLALGDFIGEARRSVGLL